MRLLHKRPRMRSSIDLRYLHGFIAVAVISSCSGERDADKAAASDAPASGQRPNILVIMADDLGYTDIGAYGSEIRTPNIDRLAGSGVSFSQFYAAPTCSPARAMMLTGVDNHLAGFGSMGEHIADNQRGRPGFEGYLNDRVVTISTMLKDAGYHTYMAGKWHLGSRSGSRPHERGFERSFALMQAGTSHFPDMQRLVSVYRETVYLEDGRRVATLPDDYYSSEFLADKTIEYVESNRRDGRPFFAWLAFTAPHWPLQVRDEHRELYAGVYDSGYDALREDRLARARDAGLPVGPAVDAPRVPTAAPWAELTEQQRRRSSRAMEIYAAMIERMDYHIGRVLKYLRDTRLEENTIVIFLSDNGAEGNDRMQLFDNRTWVPDNFDLRYENIGRPNSYAMQGPGWGQVSSVPFRYYKGFVTEGGLRAPLIVHGTDIGKSGERSHAVVTIRDLAPTILDLAGISLHGGSYDGRAVHPVSGRSFRAMLDNPGSRIYYDNEALGWELFGHRAVRKGDWKILWADGKNGSDGWQLFDLSRDPREVDDLSLQYPQKMQEMLHHWDEYRSRNNVILPEGNIGNVH